MRKRKPRVDKNKPVPPLRVLKNLCSARPEVGEEIAAWSEDGVSSSSDVRARIEERFGIVLSGDSTLSEWRSWWRQRLLLERGSSQTVEVLEWYRKNRPDAPPEELRSAQFMALSLRTEAEGDRSMQLAVLKEQGRDLDRTLASRRVELLESNAAKAKAALEGVKSKGGLTAETLRTIEEAARLL